MRHFWAAPMARAAKRSAIQQARHTNEPILRGLGHFFRAQCPYFRCRQRLGCPVSLLSFSLPSGNAAVWRAIFAQIWKNIRGYCGKCGLWPGRTMGQLTKLFRCCSSKPQGQPHAIMRCTSRKIRLSGQYFLHRGISGGAKQSGFVGGCT